MRLGAGLGICDQLLVISALRSLCAVRLAVLAKNRARGLVDGGVDGLGVCGGGRRMWKTAGLLGVSCHPLGRYAFTR